MDDIQEMYKNRVAGLKGAAMATLFLLPAHTAKAQEEEEEDVVNLSRRDVMQSEEEEEMPMPGFQLTRRMRGLIFDLIILLILVFLVSHFSSKRNRKGCVFFAIFIFIMIYIIERYIL